MRPLSGIDIALWDLLGRWPGAPVCQLLGGCQHERPAVYASSLWFRSLDVLAVGERLVEGQAEPVAP